jgi:hypothetical protein
MNARRTLTLATFVVALAGCTGRISSDHVPGGPTTITPPGTTTDPGETPTPVTSLPGHEQLGEDTTPKDGPRLMPAESYIRSYMTLFGGLAPLTIQGELDRDGLFDAWDNYLQVLGLPDYRADIARGTQTNALMIAAFERLGVALCDRAVMHDLRTTADGGAPVVLTFAVAPTGLLSEADFTTRFDTLHSRFLGYPAALAPTPDRTTRFYTLYQQAVANQATPLADAGLPARLALSPVEAGWAAVCYGLVRHPEFHLY